MLSNFRLKVRVRVLQHITGQDDSADHAQGKHRQEYPPTPWHFLLMFG